MAQGKVIEQPTRMVHVVCTNCRHEWLVKRGVERVACPRCSNEMAMNDGPKLVRLGVSR